MKMMLTKVRIAFPALFTAQTVMGEGKPSFSAVMIIDPKAQADLIKKIEANIKQVAKDKWGAKADATLKAITAKGNLCFRDGADKPDYEGFEGMMYISARNPKRPIVLDTDKTPLTEEDGKPYAGCYANISIDLWAMDNQYGKRICASLCGAQFVADGEAFGGGGVASADDFDELEATEAGTDDLFD